MGILKRLFGKKKDNPTVSIAELSQQRDVKKLYDEGSDNYRYDTSGPLRHLVTLHSNNGAAPVVIEVTREQFKWFAEAHTPGCTSKGYQIGVL